MSKLDHLTPEQKRALAKRLLAKKQAMTVPSLLQRLEHWQQQTPQKQVVQSLSYASLMQQARERAATWQGMGLVAGMRVRLANPSAAERLIDWVACLLLRACVVQGLPAFEAASDQALGTQWVVRETPQQLAQGASTEAALLIWDGRTCHAVTAVSLDRQLAFLGELHPKTEVLLHLDQAFTLPTLLALYLGGSLSETSTADSSLRFIADSPSILQSAAGDQDLRVYWHPASGGACAVEQGQETRFPPGVSGSVVDANEQVVAERMSGELVIKIGETQQATGYRVRKEGKRLRYLLNQDLVFPANVPVSRGFLSAQIAAHLANEHWWLVVDGRLVLFAVIEEDQPQLETTLRQALPQWLKPHLVPMRRLPRDPAGYVDEAALRALDYVPPAHLEAAQQSDCALVETPFFKAPSAFEWREAKTEDDTSATEAAAIHSDQPAYAKGPALRQSLPANLNAILDRALNDQDAGILHVDRAGRQEFQSYANLKQEALTILAGIEAAGVEVGAPVLLMADDSRSYFACLWACFLGGRVAVPAAIPKVLEADHLDMRKLDHAHEVLAGAPIICRQNLRLQLQRPDLWQTQPRFLEFEELLKSAEPATPVANTHASGAVMFLTSGSTGIPKLVQQGHGQLLAMAAGTVEMNDFDQQHKAINWMPLDHVGAVAFLHLTPMFAQASQVQIATSWIMQDPVRWLELIEAQRAAVAWAPNFAYGLLNGMGDAIKQRVRDLSSMVFLVNAGEANVGRVMAQFQRMCAPLGLPQAAIRPAFGMSETCSGITWSRGFEAARDGEQRFISLGPPIPGAEVRIVDGDGALLREGQVGRMQLRGPSVTAGYFANPARNAEVFVGDGWFDSGDLGYLSGGELVLTGREKEEIIVNGANFAAHDLEAHLEAHAPLVASYTAVLQTAQPEKLLVFAVPQQKQDGDALFEQLRDLLLQYAGIVPDALVILAADQVPKTGIGKIQRSRLRDAFVAGDFGSVTFGNQTDEKLPRWFYRQAWQIVQPVAGNSEARAYWRVDEPMPTAKEALVIDLREGSSSDLNALLLRFSELVKEPAFQQVTVLTRGAFSGNQNAAAAIAWWSSYAQETASIVVCCLDLPAEQVDSEDEAVDTFVNSVATPGVSRWDGRHFEVASLEAIRSSDDQSFWQPQRTYVIAGGAGGLGQVLARHILSKGARVLLLGRRAAHEANLNSDLKDSYCQVDIEDAAALKATLAAHRTELAGIFHLAGSVVPQAASQLTAEAIQLQLAAKLAGTANLCAIAKAEALPVIAFSSTTAVFGFPGVSVYAAANAAMAAQVEALPQGRVIDWSVWREHGLNAGNAVDHLHDRHGLMAIDTAVGLRSLDYLLAQQTKRAIVGLDAGHPHIRQALKGSTDLAAQRVLAFAEAQTQPLTVKDWSGRSLAVEVIEKQPLPRKQDGSIDREALTAQFRPSQSSSQYQAPTNPLEEVICEVWCEILEQRRIGIDDHFFDVGGHSLQATRVMSRLSQYFRIEFAVKYLFSAPTIRQLAKSLRGLEPKPGQLDKTIEIRKKIATMKS